MHQPIRWHEWGEEAFAAAQSENKPMLLDIGAVWCHWCHVMDRESYDDPEVAQIVNDNFIAVKVDRDERPDVEHAQRVAANEQRHAEHRLDPLLAQDRVRQMRGRPIRAFAQNLRAHAMRVL